jgi:hypothetical protein
MTTECTKMKFRMIATMSLTELARELDALERTEAGRTSFFRLCVRRELDARLGFAPL